MGWEEFEDKDKDNSNTQGVQVLIDDNAENKCASSSGVDKENCVESKNQSIVEDMREDENLDDKIEASNISGNCLSNMKVEFLQEKTNGN